MDVQHFVVSLNSENPERLIAFYRDTLGLTVVPELGPGAFKASSSAPVSLVVEGHSEVVGATMEPQRVLLNFMVGDLRAEVTRLEGAGVEFLVRVQEEAGFGLVSTFLDPDGNYCQLMQLH